MMRKEKGNNMQAMKNTNNSVNKNNEKAKINQWINVGKTYFDKRNYKEGLPFFEMVLEKDPEHVYALQCASQFYLHAGDFEKAAPLCKKLIAKGSLSPASTRLYKRLADETNHDVLDDVLTVLIHVENYEQIKKSCRDNLEKEKEALLKIKDNREQKGKEIPFEWYIAMVNNRLNAKDLEESELYLNEVEAHAVTPYDEIEAARYYHKYGMMHPEPRKIFEEAFNKMKSHPYYPYLELIVDLKIKLNPNQEMRDAQLALLKLYNQNLKIPYNKEKKREVKMQIGMIIHYQELANKLEVEPEHQNKFQHKLEILNQVKKHRTCK